MIKSILGGKSKNLFDISKADVVINANVFNSILGKWDCFYKMPVTSGQTYTVSCDTTANVGVGKQLQLSAQTGDKFGEGTRLFIFITSQEMIKDWTHIKATFTIPDNATQITFSALSAKFFRNFQLELGSTATEYVPYELTSYKSIMKVGNGLFVTSFDERMPCKTKNLFSSSTEVGVPSSTKFDKSEKRLLENGKWYVGLTGSNYYSQNSVPDYSIMENSVYIKWKNNGYAVAKCIYCEPNTTYSFTKKYSLIQGHSLGINVGFYTEDGTFISFKGETASPRFVFTTPENCKYISICLSGTKLPEDNFGAGCFSDLQLVKGSTATDYIPYNYV